MFSLNKKEKKDAWISVKNRHTGGNVTIDAATFEVFDMTGSSKQASASANISDNGTPTPDVSGLVDATALGIVADTDYEVVFKITIGNEILYHRKQMYCESVRF